jgi:hypothetical protein
MPIQRIYQKPYKVIWICDKCGDGIMEYSGISYSTNPPMYPHKCSKCGNPETVDNIYPRIEYENVYETNR